MTSTRRAVLCTMLCAALTITIVQNGLNLHAIGSIIMFAIFIDVWRTETWGLFTYVLEVPRRTSREEVETQQSKQEKERRGHHNSRSTSATTIILAMISNEWCPSRSTRR